MAADDRRDSTDEGPKRPRTADPLPGLHEIDLAPGRTLAEDYEVVRTLGAGATAVIFEVKRVADDARFAAKILRPSVLEVEFVRDKFEAEIRILAELRHPHIVSLIEPIHEPGVDGIILELIDGSTLEEYLPLHPGGLSEVLALEIALQVVDAMAYAHELDVVHRDLKPSNILLQQRESGQLDAVVADFGLAKAIGQPKSTRTGLRIGTVAYMAPEQIHDASRVDARADIYALGITLYECLTGELPFPYKSIYDVVQAQLSREVPSVRNRRPDLAREWDTIIGRACAKDKTVRYQSANELLNALHELAHASGLLHRSTIAIAPVRPREDDGGDADDDHGRSDRRTMAASAAGAGPLVSGLESATGSSHGFVRESTDQQRSPDARPATLHSAASLSDVGAAETALAEDTAPSAESTAAAADLDELAAAEAPTDELERDSVPSLAPSVLQGPSADVTGTEPAEEGSDDGSSESTDSAGPDDDRRPSTEASGISDPARTADEASGAEGVGGEARAGAERASGAGSPAEQATSAPEARPIESPRTVPETVETEGPRRDDIEAHRAEALGLIGDTGPSRTALWALFGLLLLGLAGLGIGLYFASR